jgi:putative inorganic carbon (hco3(-)) transporter
MTAPPIRRRGVVARAGDRVTRDGGWTLSSAFAGLHWSPAFVAFLVYVFVITTYRLNVGTVAMGVALVTLPLERTSLRIPPLALLALAFLGWGFVGWGSSDYPTIVWERLIEFAKICGVVLVAVNVLTTRPRLRFFLLAYLAYFAFYPVRGAFFNYFLYSGTMAGRAVWNYAYANPNDLAGICLLFVALSAGVLVSERTRWIRWSAFAGIVLLPFLIILTQSRGAFVALLAFALIALKGQWRRGRVLALAAGVAVALFFAAPDDVWERLGTIQTVATRDDGAAVIADEGSAEQRLEIWKVARAIIADEPVTGVGLGAYHEVHYRYALRPVFNPTAQGKRDTHSTYLKIFAETGVVGLIIFLGLVAFTLLDAERTRRRKQGIDPAGAKQLYYMELGMIGYLVAGIWGSYGELVPTYLFLSLIYAATRILKMQGMATRQPAPLQAVRARGIPAGTLRRRAR